MKNIRWVYDARTTHTCFKILVFMHFVREIKRIECDSVKINYFLESQWKASIWSKWFYFCITTTKKPFLVSLVHDYTENLYVIEIYFVFFHHIFYDIIQIFNGIYLYNIEIFWWKNRIQLRNLAKNVLWWRKTEI